MELSNCLGVKAVETHSKYLGLPTLIGKSKKLVFAGIVDRVVKKMQSWKEKSLSQAGKEILIKAIIQAIPSYAMSCFLFPISTCQDIERATARFFWGSTVEDRKCHWAAWDILTTNKANGGIGFKELPFFNLAMLAKQLWTLAQHNNSLTYRLLKAKYFPRAVLMQAEVGYKPSYLWRSLLAAKGLVQEGEAWRIGNGAMVRIGTDRWIGVGNPIKSRGVLQMDFHNMPVSALIDSEEGKWKISLLEHIFHPEEVAIIKGIPLSRNSPDDRRIWMHTTHGFFTVKVIPRVKMFLWRACTNSLPTKVNLCRRGCEVDPICIVCGEKEETVDHLFLTCMPVTRVWYTSVLRINTINEITPTFREWLWQYLKTLPKDAMGLLAYTLWEIWKRRNIILFEGKNFDSQEVNRRAYSQWNEFMDEDTQNVPRERNQQKDIHWAKPRQGTYKLNCDVAVLSHGRIGMGFVVQEENGKVILAGKQECLASGNSTVVESIAMRFACRMANQFNVNVEVIECDSKLLIAALNAQHTPPAYCDILVEDIKSLASKIGCSSFKFIQRNGNKVAHLAARGPDFLSIRHTPIHLRTQLELDSNIN